MHRSPTPSIVTAENRRPAAPRSLASSSREAELSLCETLDRVLTKGVVAQGELVISVAGVDLIHLGLGAVLSSVETVRDAMADAIDAGPASPPTQEPEG